ncbi:MAG: hypothetical protein HYX53_07910 [Chloroflexi bacterium]|nr:hypothetical protein [Chloroflexota bacterium]
MSRLALFGVAAALALAATQAESPGAAHAQAGTCIPSINGQDIAEHTTPGKAIDINRKSQDLELGIISRNAIGNVDLKIEAGPWSTNIAPRPQTARPDADWLGTSPASDYAKGGTGLYKVTITSTGGCQAVAWINITGKSPFATYAGAAATVVALAGLAIQAAGLWLLFQRRGWIWLALAAGAATGAGLAVLGQQAGLAALVPKSVVLWVAPPVVIGGAAGFGLRRWRGGRPRGRDDEDKLDDEPASARGDATRA